MLTVEILDKKSGVVVARVPVVLGGLNYQPSEAEAFDLAWSASIEDSLVSSERENYSFRVSPTDG